MFKNRYIKNVLSALAVAVFGFVLLNLTFLFDFLFQSLIVRFIKLFIPIIVDPEMDYHWFPPMMHASFVVVIGLISWFIFKSKLGKIYKAIYSTVPLAVVFATIGIFLYRWPVLAYGINTLVFGVILFYLYKTKKPWIYYYTLILVALVLLIFTLSGGEI